MLLLSILIPLIIHNSINFTAHADKTEIIVEPFSENEIEISINNNENVPINVVLNTYLEGKKNITIPPKSSITVSLIYKSRKPCTEDEEDVSIYARKGDLWDRRDLHFKIYTVCPKEQKSKILEKIRQDVELELRKLYKKLSLILFLLFVIAFVCVVLASKHQ